MRSPMRSPLRSPLRSPARSPARSVMPLPKWKPRRTTIDLYNEKDGTPWYWKMSAMTAAFMIMIGFLVFPSAFINETDLTVHTTSAGAAAGVFIALGYVLSGLSWFFCKSWLFRLDCIFGPCLSSCVFGLFNVAYNLNIRPSSTHHWTAASISALTLAAISTLVYTALALLTYRKIHIVRSRDAMHRHNTDGESLLPEDEMQRQQLLRLLLQRDGKKVSNELSRSTYRIDLPDAPLRTTTHLSAPQNVYGYDVRQSRSRSVPADPVVDRSTIQTSPTPPTVHVEEPTLTSTNPFPQYPQEQPPPAAEDYQPHPNGLGIEGIVNTRTRTPSLPMEKQEQLTRELSLRHPAERANYHIVDPPSPQLQYTPQMVEEVNRLSRESRRAEIELEDRSWNTKRRADVEIDGVEFTPRINRVTTDGWGDR